MSDETDPMAATCARLNIQLAETAIERDQLRAELAERDAQLTRLREAHDAGWEVATEHERDASALRAANDALTKRLEEAGRLLGELPKSIDQWSFSLWRTYLARARAFLAPSSSPTTCDGLIGSLRAPCTKPRNHGGACEHEYDMLGAAVEQSPIPAVPASAQGMADRPCSRCGSPVSTLSSSTVCDRCSALWTEAYQSGRAFGIGQRDAGLEALGKRVAALEEGGIQTLAAAWEAIRELQGFRTYAKASPPQPAPVAGVDYAAPGSERTVQRCTGCDWTLNTTAMTEDVVTQFVHEHLVKDHNAQSAPLERHAFFVPPDGSDSCWHNVSSTDSYVRCGQPRSAAVHGEGLMSVCLAHLPSDDDGWNDATRANYERDYGEGPPCTCQAQESPK